MRFLLCLIIVLQLANSATSAAEDKTPDSFLPQGPPIRETRIYWKDGLHIDNDRLRLKNVLNAVINVDFGTISPDATVDEAFPDLAVSDEVNVRRLRLDVRSHIGELWDFKAQFNLADNFDLGDFYFTRREVPYFNTVITGHIREPFSLEALSSSQSMVFMERSLPSEAFAPGRNIGLLTQNTTTDERLSWAAGVFLATGNFDEIPDPKDAIENATGANLTGRITVRPMYRPDESKLLNLGLSYSHLFRDIANSDEEVQFRARPESNLTNERLVDTGQFATNGVNLINLEAAYVHGPSLLQGEYFHARTTEGQNFGGFYLLASYLINGGEYNFNRNRALFARVKPDQNFRPDKGSWGALELGLRLSYIDLNDGPIRGGRQRNLGVALNWHLNSKIRLSLNYINAQVKDRADPEVDEGNTDVFQARFQLNF